MSECYDQKLCDEKHKSIEDKLNVHDVRLNNHADRLDKLEQDNTANRADIKNLCKDIQNLIATIKWGIGVFTAIITILLTIIGLLIKK